VKAILFSDIHLGLSQDNPLFHQTTLDFASWMAAEATARGVDTLICGGDVFHSRKAIALSTIDVAYKFFEILKDFNVRIITGNHDCLYLDNSNVHSISLLKQWENISVYDEPHYENIGGKMVGFIPWGTNVSEMLKCDVMFGHYEITGFQMGPAAFCKEGMTATDLLKKSPLIFSGHFHKPQKNTYKAGEIIYMGSPYQHNWGEKGQEKYIYELDFKTLELIDIENTESPKHVEISDAADIDLVDGNIVRIFADDKDSDLIELVKSKDTATVEAIVEDKQIKKAAETIADFKGVDFKSGFVEVTENIEGPSKTLKKKINAKVIDYLEQVG